MSVETPAGAATSVIIPTYNRSDLVSQCVSSLRVAGLSGLEIIVVDDGGSDDTEDVVRGQATYLRQANSGPAAARNRGFGASAGRFVAFIDSDDQWIPEGIRRLERQLASNPDIDVIFGDSLMGNADQGFVSFVDTYGGSGFHALPAEVRPDGLCVLERAPFFRALSTRNVMFLGSMLFRREFFERLGGFAPALRGAADWELFMRAAHRGRVAYSRGSAVSRYYKHAGGMSLDVDHMELDFIEALASIRARERLEPELKAHVDWRLREHIFGWAWMAYERGDLSRVRSRLRLAARYGQFGVREATYWLVACLPGPAVSALRRLKRARPFGS